MRYARTLTAAIVAAIVGILLYLHTPPAHGAEAPEPKVLNVHNWSDYIADATTSPLARCAR